VHQAVPTQARAASGQPQRPSWGGLRPQSLLSAALKGALVPARGWDAPWRPCESSAPPAFLTPCPPHPPGIPLLASASPSALVQAPLTRPNLVSFLLPLLFMRAPWALPLPSYSVRLRSAARPRLWGPRLRQPGWGSDMHTLRRMSGPGHGGVPHGCQDLHRVSW